MTIVGFAVDLFYETKSAGFKKAELFMRKFNKPTAETIIGI